MARRRGRGVMPSPVTILLLSTLLPSCLPFTLSTSSRLLPPVASGAFAPTRSISSPSSCSSSQRLSPSSPFVSPSSRAGVAGVGAAARRRAPRSRKGTVTMDAFSDGVLGVGPQEVVVICVVGYFLLGPTELYRLAKEVGKLVTQLRQTATEASSAFSETMEQQLAISEIKAASDELQDAFSNPLSFEARQSRVMGEEAAMEAAKARAAAAEAEAATAAAAAAAAAATTGASTEEEEATAVAPPPEDDPWGGSMSDEWPGDIPQTLEAPDSLGAGFGAQASKFEQQMSGEWNQAVLRGDGPWSQEDSAAMAARDQQQQQQQGTFARARELAAGNEDVLLEIAYLENEKAMALVNLDDEFEAKRKLLEEQFSRKEDVVTDFAEKVAALEAAMLETKDEEAAGEGVEEEANGEGELETKDEEAVGEEVGEEADAETEDRNPWYGAAGERGSWYDAGIRLTNPWFLAKGERGSWYDAGVRMK